MFELKFAICQHTCLALACTKTESGIILAAVAEESLTHPQVSVQSQTVLLFLWTVKPHNAQKLVYKFLIIQNLIDWHVTACNVILRKRPTSLIKGGHNLSKFQNKVPLLLKCHVQLLLVCKSYIESENVNCNHKPCIGQLGSLSDKVSFTRPKDVSAI